MAVIFHKGKFYHHEEVPMSPRNRAFRYADGCFEAIRIAHNAPVFWSQHFNRLSSTLELMMIELDMTEQELKALIIEMIDRNELNAGAILRMVVYRAGSGKYFPTTNKAAIYMELIPLLQHTYPEPPMESNAMFYDRLPLPAHPLGNHKLLNKTIHVNAAVLAQKEGCNEALLINDRGEVAEAISSNVWVFNDQTLVTPPLASGCLNGTLRKVVLEHAEDFKLQVLEASVTKEKVMAADEVWTTNAGSGITAIKRLGGRTFGSAMAAHVQAHLNQLAVNSTVGFRENLP